MYYVPKDDYNKTWKNISVNKDNKIFLPGILSHCIQIQFNNIYMPAKYALVVSYGDATDNFLLRYPKIQ